MQACTFANGCGGAVLGIALVFAGCHSSGAPAETPMTTAAKEDLVAAPSSQPNAEGPAPGSSAKQEGEKWEGEAEATHGASSSPGKADRETRTTELIQKVIVDNRKPFRDCYDKARKELPDLRGTLTVHFVLDPAGKVKQAELNVERSDLKSPAVADCTVAALKKLSFPESSRGMDTTVNYPFDFKP
jgi:outer membrane biosynthesis protein TonB